MWGWDDRSGNAGSLRLTQHDEATASAAKIIPLRPWFDPPPSRVGDSLVKFADEKGVSAEASTAPRIAEPRSAEPFLRKVAKTEAKTVAKPEARTEARAEAKTPAPGSTVVIEQAVPAPPLRTGGDKNGGGSSGGRGGGGGGGNSPPLHKRSSDNEFRDVLGSGLANARRNLVTVGLFSVAVNLLVLAIPIYLFNMSDRVMTSRSTDTLVMLTIIVVIAIGAHVLMDMMRRIILMRVAVETEARLGGPVLSAAAKAAQSGSSREFQTLADLQHLRAFITGPVLLTMFDTPVAPVYFAVVFLIHPHLGFIVLGSGVALVVVALLNQRVTALPFNQANNYGTRANLQAESMARNAQVINAMGMIPEGVVVWGRETVESLKAQVIGQDRNILMTGLSKFLRLCTQIAILGWGAWLALESQITSGMVIAASIVASRALAPLEGTIEGWRNFVQARSAYARVKALLLNSPLNLERLRLPRPAGYLNVERILYVPPPNKKVILNGISFQLKPGESLAIVGDSGTGKTMLARMLVGSIIPTAGSVRLDMMDLRNWDPRQFGESVGYLPQDVQLFPATIKANIGRMRDDARDEDVFDAAEIADVHEMISSFAQGYETVVGMDGSPLSGGQRQRIGLARAFFGNPRLLVLDEPNSNLDANGERALAKALLRAKEKQITVVTITQRAALLMSVDKIMILHQGAVQAFGSRDEIIPMITGRKPNSTPTGPDGPPSLN
ncbi:type I secretion system permease/ATPase [Bradyrhizobium archetypum]|uniref:Type I secretion system permease/ATPase n=1 Tax=Bradyrhizobium archetypum TaxID=2721160 RepID=A0A7Y4M0Y6_9BRAD|nr:type I secretion system permease/ATPase [Bradyrhizobium archetypum]NOJ45315.1 type I secretion system permease/ATPase [Bradyrhizobium archetypum]